MIEPLFWDPLRHQRQQLWKLFYQFLNICINLDNHHSKNDNGNPRYLLNSNFQLAYYCLFKDLLCSRREHYLILSPDIVSQHQYLHSFLYYLIHIPHLFLLQLSYVDHLIHFMLMNHMCISIKLYSFLIHLIFFNAI